MIAVAYNPVPLPPHLPKRPIVALEFTQSMLDALPLICARWAEWSPSVSIQLFGATAADFADETW